MNPWWLSPCLDVRNDSLHLGGVSLWELVRQHGTPLYAYSEGGITAQVELLQQVLGGLNRPFRICYAMKANRFPPVLALMRRLGMGIDACSPREVEVALAQGFKAEHLSYTSGMLSRRDLERLVRTGVHLTLDTLSVLRRYAEIPGHRPDIGLRINPGVLAGYGDHLAYGNSKFGFDPENMQYAIKYANQLGLGVDVLHFHLGWGVKSTDREALISALKRVVALARTLPSMRWINVGGGLGARLKAGDQPLPLSDWAESIGDVLEGTELGVMCEPGTVLVGAAGVLLAEVNTVESRRGVTWVGVDMGQNISVFAAHYGLPLQIVRVRSPLDPPTQTYTVVGNINEAGDILGQGVNLPELQEGDLLAFLPAGAYGSSMASDHCLRGEFRECWLP